MLKCYKVLKMTSIKGSKYQAGDCDKGEMIYCIYLCEMWPQAMYAFLKEYYQVIWLKDKH